MAADWSFAAVVVAIFAVLLTPGPLALIQKVTFAVLSFCRLSCTQCERLTWMDIRDNVPLHECTLPNENCEHHRNPTLTSFFNRRAPSEVVRKPAQLELNTAYIRTDTKTLRAFLMLLNRKEICLIFKEVDTIMTAYVKIKDPESRSYSRVRVSKAEMNRLLDGYPPWYQDPLPLVNGDFVPHPSKEKEDIFRGGWVVAVALSYTQPVASSIRAARRREHESVKFVISAFERVLHCLDLSANAFGHSGLKREKSLVAFSIEYIRGSKVPSALYNVFSDSPLRDEFGPEWFRGTRDFAKVLTKGQCTTAMNVFNQYKEPSHDQVRILKAVWRISVRAALWGTYMIASHLRRVTSKYQQPPELLEDRSVYLFQPRDVDE